MKSKTKQTAIFVSGTGTGYPDHFIKSLEKNSHKNRFFLKLFANKLEMEDVKRQADQFDCLSGVTFRTAK